MPAAILHNGKACAANGPCSIDQLTVLRVRHGKTYRLRLINKAAMSYFNFAIDGHELTIVEIDGNLVQPKRVQSVEINTGQRISVLLTANRRPASYY